MSDGFVGVGTNVVLAGGRAQERCRPATFFHQTFTKQGSGLCDRSAVSLNILRLNTVVWILSCKNKGILDREYIYSYTSVCGGLVRISVQRRYRSHCHSSLNGGGRRCCKHAVGEGRGRPNRLTQASAFEKRGEGKTKRVLSRVLGGHVRNDFQKWRDCIKRRTCALQQRTFMYALRLTVS